MKNVSGAFLTMLQTSASLVEADLYTITLAGGTVLYYTSAQQNIVYNGHTYLAAFQDSAPGFRRGASRCSLGLNVDEMEIEIVYDTSTRMVGYGPAVLAANGGLDGAQIQVDKALAPNWSNPVVNGVVNLFTGIVGEAKCDSSKVTLTVSSMLLYLNANFPRNYFLTQCNHALFDGGCTLSKAAFAVNGSVTGGGSLNGFNSNCTQADGWFALGSLVWTSGFNNGVLCAVKWYVNASGAFSLIYPLSVVPNIGDTFTAYPGCDKLQATCANKFSNQANYRGFPYAPTPETLEVGGTGSAPPAAVGGNGGAGLSQIARGPGALNGSFKQQ